MVGRLAKWLLHWRRSNSQEMCNFFLLIILSASSASAVAFPAIVLLPPVPSSCSSAKREGGREEVRNVSWARNLEGRYCVHWRAVWEISARAVVVKLETLQSESMLWCLNIEWNGRIDVDH